MTSTYPGAKRLNNRSLSMSNNQSLLLERTKLGNARRSTPDSDALASSDDEHDLHHSFPSLTQHSSTASAIKPSGRRSSWLTDINPNPTQRKVSFSNNSQPSTQGENGPWPSSAAPRASAPGVTNPWAPQIWGSEARREGPARLSEVVQSPTSLGPSIGSFPEESPPVRRPSDAGSALPVSISNMPLFKPVRSQSYSVGQQESDGEMGGPRSALAGGSPFATRTSRGLPPLKHRPSRPSLLGESAGLSQLREDEDDADSLIGSDNGVRLTDQVTDATRGSVLRQAAHENAQRIRQQRASMAATANESNFLSRNLVRRAATFSEADSAVIEDDNMDPASVANPSLGYGMNALNSENRHLENARRGHWRTSFDFAVEDEGQSRRHSFAGNVLSIPFTGQVPDERPRADYQQAMIPPEDIDPSYFGGYGVAQRQGYYENLEAQPVTTSPTRINPYEPVQTKPAKRLYLVAFKCSRAEIYYIHENTGLELNPGDMVMVDGDRGQDLGTVTYGPLTMKKAKELKDAAHVDHMRWLLMFSRWAQAMIEANGGSSAELFQWINVKASSVRGTAAHDVLTDVKPKAIKRLAQAHEIGKLKDKEGGEAKAKRFAQAKVIEHGLNMEILDAEFQLDYKKLTFYYFAESYINFNELVTDLFKNFKTRIWMSAVNPYSMVHPSGTGQVPLGLPSIPAPGAITGPNAQMGSPMPPVGVGFGGRNIVPGVPRTTANYSMLQATSPQREESQGPQQQYPSSPAGYMRYQGAPIAPPRADTALMNEMLQQQYLAQQNQAWGAPQMNPWGNYSPYGAPPMNPQVNPYVGCPPSTFPASPTTISGQPTTFGNGNRNSPTSAGANGSHNGLLNAFQGMNLGNGNGNASATSPVAGQRSN